jgi:inner membrane protein
MISPRFGPVAASIRCDAAAMNRSLILKALLVGALALVLMVPVGMIRGLVFERQARSAEAIAGIAEGWGKRQTVANPYLVLPYERRWIEIKRETIEGRPHESRIERVESKVVRIPAGTADWSIAAELSEKARGIYKARLYHARLQADGSIELPARAALEDGTSRYKWGTPRLVFLVSDPIGIRAAPDLALGGSRYAFAAGAGDPGAGNGLHAPLADLQATKAQSLDFSLSFELAGSEAFSLSPRGADTRVAMRADWPHPSFQGRFLPAKHEITGDGFTAAWAVSRFATASGNEQIAVSFIEPAGLYQQLERSSKYGFLFVGLTFAAFVLFELLRRLAIHPIQYTLVGLALAMFFLLLTALSEHIAFASAYAIASLACVGVISAYLVRVLHSARIGIAFGAALASLFGMLFALLQAEDYSLLGGALLLFVVLAAVMLGTRRVDWYALTTRQA